MTTLFSPTLKVKENKVVLYFHLGLKQARYVHFHVLNISISKIKVAKHENVHILLVVARNEKIRPFIFSNFQN